jgi:hypothetical protein
MIAALRPVRTFLVSLRLTVALLALGMVLIFWATLAQVDLGVWGVQERFFHRFFIVERVPFTPLWAPFVGGYFIGTLLLLNLIAAHIDRFKFTLRKIGIQLTHAGLILLLLGELLSGLWQESYTMRLAEGSALNYAEHERNFELALIDTTAADYDDVVVIPTRLLERNEPVQHPKLPFRVVPHGYYPNAALARREPNSTAPASPATAGVGASVTVTPLPVTYKEKEVNVPAAFVELVAANGSLGTWLVSPDLASRQTFTHDGHTWKIVMRAERLYQPFSIHLLEVHHDVYAGTDIPKNYSSRVRLMSPDRTGDREVLIYMNNPLRYGGLTFYQYQMDAGHKESVLQVVRNPSWRLPYIACIMMAAGLVQQFGSHLLNFLRKRRAATTPAVA